jgi:hypothetical protein
VLIIIRSAERTKKIPFLSKFHATKSDSCLVGRGIPRISVASAYRKNFLTLASFHKVDASSISSLYKSRGIGFN